MSRLRVWLLLCGGAVFAVLVFGGNPNEQLAFVLAAGFALMVHWMTNRKD